LAVAVVSLIGLAFIVVIFLMRRPPKKIPVVKGEDNVIPAAELVDINGITGKKSHKISKPMTVIGREAPVKQDKDMDLIIINKKTVSGLHAIIEYRDKHFYLIDRDSTNGTYVNEGIERKERISSGAPKGLKPGDRIAFAEYTFEFRVAGQAAWKEVGLGPKPGGTVIRPGPPKAEPADQETKIKPGALKQEPEISASPPPPLEEDEGTIIKQTMCERHPAFKVIELCSICHKTVYS